MKNRLEIAREFLRDDGVIFIQCDDNEQAYLKVLCDEIFGRDNFVATICWQKKNSPQNDAKWLSDNHDFILIYAKNKDVWRPNLLPRTKEMNARYKNPDNDHRGDWMAGDLSVKTYSANYDYPIETPSGRIVYPPTSRSWRTSKENFEKLKQDNRIWFGKNGDNTPTIKRFLSEVKDGLTAVTLWLSSDVGTNLAGKNEIKALFLDSRPLRGAEALKQGGSSAAATLELEADKRGTPLDCRKSGGFFGAKGSGEGINPFLRKEKDSKENSESTMLDSVDFHEATASRNDKVVADDSNNAESHNDKNNETALFATPKPEALLKRIIEIATNKGDLVMDFFAGSGTTLAVAHKMQRRWIGIEQMDYIESITKERLKKVVSGEQGGISKAVDFKGGGSFIYLELMALNAVYREKILNSSDEKELEKLYKDLESKAFTNYRVDIQEMLKDKEANIYKEFHDLSLEEKKGILYEILDPNMDYVPYSEIEDNSYGVSDETIELNRIFYGEGDFSQPCNEGENTESKGGEDE